MTELAILWKPGFELKPGFLMRGGWALCSFFGALQFLFCTLKSHFSASCRAVFDYN